MRKVILFALIFILFSDLIAAGKVKKIESIPFEMAGSFVVIKVRINDSSPLNLILDTGIRNTIITELLSGDKISLNYSDVKDLMGLGGGDHLGALTSNYNTLKVGKLSFQQKIVYVLQEDIFNLSKRTGLKINGLIGVDLFQDYVVEIDYTRKRIRFYDSKNFVNPKEYGMLPLTVESQKMFTHLSVSDADSTKKKVKMLIDTGAELNAWFQTFKKNAINIPKNNFFGTIGQGLNGEITGKFGRIPEIFLGDYSLKKLIVSFPDSATISDIVQNSDRDGTLGSQLLSRFNLYIDYPQKLFFFKPNGNFNKRSTYNIAGIEITQIIPFIPQVEVWHVWDNSPAAAAGIQIGDQILEINGQKAFQYNIDEIKVIFETPSRQPLNLVIMRDGKEISVEIDMKSKI
jgi:hypothetical protein